MRHIHERKCVSLKTEIQPDSEDVVALVLIDSLPEIMSSLLVCIVLRAILRRFGLEATVRPSFDFYKTYEEIDLMELVIEPLARQKR